MKFFFGLYHMNDSFGAKVFRVIMGLFGITLVIVVHEFGHFITARLFGVATPIFSIGFGPALLTIPTRWTSLVIAALPIGGYVALDPVQFEMQPYWIQLIIMLAGVFMNFFAAYAVFIFLAATKIHTLPQHVAQAHEQVKQHADKRKLFKESNGGIIGPFGIISLLGRSAQEGWRTFLFVCGLLSIDVGIFNLIIPLPFLDGGKVLLITLQALGFRNSLFLHIILFMLVMMIISFIQKMMIQKRG